ncbi:MAG: hypothetical protein KC468_25110, partial [Myxococcales bacterium]|nr:hypothetical protein [Myxococcales bacterium]
CTTLCAAPACDDGLLSGDESDVDCGGGCGGCELGGVCNGNPDCGEGLCIDNACAQPGTCKDILDADPQATSGQYLVAGEGNEPDFQVYCDMDTDGGGWTIVYAIDVNDNRKGLTGDAPANNNPLLFEFYNRTRAQKMIISARTTESLFYRENDTWLKASAPLFDANLDTPNSHSHFAATLTANNGATTNGFIGYANYNISHGGDYNVSLPDGATCNGNTVMGVDHHSTSYYHLNCGCQRHYLYSYSSQVGDGDASYKVNTTLGSWTATAGCSNAELNGLVFYAAMR